MVPLRADVFKGQAKWRAASGGERRSTQVNRIVIASALLQNAKRNFLYLCDLPQRIFET